MKLKTFFAAFAVVMIAAQFSSCTQNEVTPYTDATELWPAYSSSHGKCGFIDKKGTFVISPLYDEVSSFSCGYALVSLNGTEMFIDKKGKMQQTPSFDWADGFWNNYAVVSQSGKYGLLNNKFEYVIQPFYYDLGNAGSNGLLPAKMSSGDKYGYVNTKGENKIVAMYDYASEFIGDYAAVRMNDNRGIINKSGDYVIQPIYDWVYPLGNKRFVYCDYKTYNYGLLKEDGQVLVPAIYDYIDYDDTPYLGWKMLPAERNDKYGYIDKDGNTKITFQYDRAYAFNEGYAFVKLNDRYMLIDEKGNIALTLAENEEPYSEFVHNGLIITGVYKEDSYSYSETTYYKDVKGNIIYTWTYNSDDDDYWRAPARKTRNAETLKDKELRTNPLIYYLGKKSK